jgi:hypothetical protein
MVPVITALAALITAFAALAWPVAAVIALFLFRPNIARLIDNVRRAEIGSGGLKVETKELQEAAARIEQTARTEPEVIIEPPSPPKALLPPPPVQAEANIKLGEATLTATGTVTAAGTAPAQRELDQHSHEVATAASVSPKAALVLLSAEIERQLRELLAATGWHRLRKITSVPVGFAMLAEAVPLSPEIREAALRFWEMRNKLVHGRGVDDDDVISAIDSGLKILKAIAAIPREVNVVYHPGVEVFADAKGQHLVTTAKALILETTGPTAEGTIVTSRRVYPTTRTDYKKGQLVAWEWNMRPTFGESWYRDPETGKFEYGWTESAEFIGRPMDQVT